MARNYRLPKNYKETDIKFSVRDLSMPKATTLMQCLNIPIFGEELISHDKFRIKFASLLQSNALQTPLFGRYKLRVSTFNCPMTNYYGFMDNNTKLTADEWDAMPHWTISPNIYGLAELNGNTELPAYSSSSSSRVNSYLRVASVLPVWNSSVFYNVAPDNTWKDYPKSDNANGALIRSLSVQPGSFLDYMGFPTRYFALDTESVPSADYVHWRRRTTDTSSRIGVTGWSFNAHFILAYLDCIRSYLVNKQLSYTLYTATILPEATNQDLVINVLDPSVPGTTFSDAITKDFKGQRVFTMPLASLDSFFLWLRQQKEPSDLFLSLCEYLYADVNDVDRKWAADIILWLSLLRFGGLFCCTYEADMLQNLLTDVEGAEAFVDIVNGKFSINEFRLANRKQRKRERVAVSGGRYKDILRALWNAKSRSGVDIPDFINTTSYMIDPRNIVSTADTEIPDASGGKSLGQMAGNVNQYKAGKYGHVIKTEDPSLVMMIVSLVPEVMYSDGVDKNLLSTRFSDDYSPQFDQVGFQDVPSILYDMRPVVTGNNFYCGTRPEDVVTVGKNVAWMRYLTNVGRVHGGFARGEQYDSYVLSRDYGRTAPVPSVPSFYLESAPNGYAVPMDYQYPFIIQQSDFPNWFFQLDLNIRATRAIGKNYMPTLGK